MTLFFLILLAVSLAVFGFKKLKKKTKLTIKPSLPKIEENQPEQALPVTPAQSDSEPVSPEPKTPMSTSEPVIDPKPTLTPEPTTVELPTLEPEPISLPVEEEPMLLSPKDPEPPGNLPIE